MYGGTLDPHAAWLVQRGLKTLALRMRQQCASALALAQALEGHAQVCISAGFKVYGTLAHLAAACLLHRPNPRPITHRVIHQCWTLISLYQGLSSGGACDFGGAKPENVAAQVDRVHYPGLPSSPDHARAKAFFDGSGGGVLAFEVRGGAAAADALLAVRASHRQCCMQVF